MQKLGQQSIGSILLYGLAIRLTLLSYCIYHDSHIDHIKYTDIDYHVFTNGSQAISDGKSPYDDTEYRYSPLVAAIFVPNILINHHVGKFMLIFADIICGHLIYLLNIYQGTHRVKSKIGLILWLFNPVTIAISTRGSFEPIQTLLVLSTVYLLVQNCHITAGWIFGISVNLKIYPLIYSLAFYGFMINRRPYMLNQSRLFYWIKTIKPSSSQIQFFTTSALTFLSSSYISYYFYGEEYLEQSFYYHLKRVDLQHNFSIYFYLFRLFPQHQDTLSRWAFVIQALGVVLLSLNLIGLETNQKLKLRKLSFNLFCTTFFFVSTNKVCTSQYFSWYLIYVPLILDSLTIDKKQAVTIIATWLLAQANWLLFAYLYEYQKYDIIDYVGNSSLLFLISNLWILVTLCNNFDCNRLKTVKKA